MRALSWIHHVGAALLLLSAAAMAQDFPTKPIRIVVPYPPGGQTDIFARILAEQMSKSLDKPVTVDNRPGAGTTLGASMVAKAAPDGYNILVGAASATAITPLTIKNVNFDPKQITPITLIAKVPYILVASKNFAPNNMAELLAYAKANPGKINWATHGMGAAQHLTANSSPSAQASRSRRSTTRAARPVSST